MTTALYRRYRPETFEDVIGQEHVTVPLMQALRTGRVNHAYLFSGPRGCGKTTSARILARCLNCEQGPTATPCGVCDSCVALARGGPGSVDVIEIDAASHGGVDDARDLRERASYGPAQSRYKVYIIDEAHMVTPQGFNALLKIVEEPPEHVKFVFATTEPEKVIGTIRSRTHHYPFRLVPPARLASYLEQICDSEGVPVAAGVLSCVVRAGGGSVRDSLSVLDQLIAGSGPEGLTYDGAAALLGFTDAELLDATVDALAAGDGAGVFRQVDRVIESGHDPRRFVEDLLERLRDLIIVAATAEGASAVLRGIPADQLDRMRVQQAAFGPGALSRAADIVNAGLTEMTGATSPRLHLELICARVLLPGASGVSGYAARLDRIERRLELSGSTPAPARTPEVSIPEVSTPAPVRAPEVSSAGVSRPEVSSAEVSSPDVSTAAPAPTPEVLTPAAGQVPEHGAAVDVSNHDVSVPEVSSPPPVSTPEVSTPRQAPAPVASAGGLDTDAVRRAWPDVLSRVFTMRRATWTFLSAHAQVRDLSGERLVLTIATTGLASAFRAGNHSEIVRQALIDEIGLEVRVEGVPAGESDDSGPGSGPSSGPGSGSGSASGSDSGGFGPPSADPSASGSATRSLAAPRTGPTTRSGAGTSSGSATLPSAPPGAKGRASTAAGPGTVAPAEPTNGAEPPRASGPSSMASTAAPVRSASPAYDEDDIPPPDDEPPPEDAPPARPARRLWDADPADPRRAPNASSPAAASPTRPTLRAVPSLGAAFGASDDADPDLDEDVSDAGAVGQAVIEDLLGGRVIEEHDG